jgi:hypothetical protein
LEDPSKVLISDEDEEQVQKKKTRISVRATGGLFSVPGNVFHARNIMGGSKSPFRFYYGEIWRIAIEDVHHD